MKRLSLLISLFAMVTAHTPDAGAQLLWKQCHIATHTPAGVDFTAMSCSGNVCTVAGIAYIDGPPYSMLVFERSTDGGISWQEQIPPSFGHFDLLADYVPKIQQLDSLRAIALVDSQWIKSNYPLEILAANCYFITTSDGGVTWTRPAWPDSLAIFDFHFSSPSTGVFSTWSSVFTTTDSGAHWRQAAVPNVKYITACHSYGGGSFSFWDNNQRRLYATQDNWSSYTSTKSPFDSVPIDHYGIQRFIFGGGDTIIGLGGYYDSSHAFVGALIRTTDRGATWQDYAIFHPLGDMAGVTSLDRDTLYAGSYYDSRLLISTDAGATWSLNDVLCDTDLNLRGYFALSVTASGNPLAIFGDGSEYAGQHLFRGEYVRSSVREDGRRESPTSDVSVMNGELRISHGRSDASVTLYDVLGREMVRGRLDGSGAVSVNIAALPSGSYYLVFDGDDMAGRVCKVMIGPR